MQDFEPFIAELDEMEAALQELQQAIDPASFDELLPLIQHFNSLMLRLSEHEAAFERLILETRGRGGETMLLLRKVTLRHIGLREKLKELLTRIGAHPAIPGRMRQ